LEKWVEPLGAHAWLTGDRYRTDFIEQAWRYLLQNHSHDSICGCSVDDVHEEMVVRYKKSMAISEELISRQIRHITSQIDTSGLQEKEIPVVVFNPLGWEATEMVTVQIDLDEHEAVDMSALMLTNSCGKAVAASFIDHGKVFTYDLPEDSFRIPKYVRRIQAEFCAEKLPALGYAAYVLKTGSSRATGTLLYEERYAENEFLKLDIHENGSLTVQVKKNGHIFRQLNMLEECGDIGNEYNFVMAQGGCRTTKDSTAEISIHACGSTYVVFKVSHQWMLPEQADTATGVRCEKCRRFVIDSYITLHEKSNRIDMTTEFDNQVQDHRIRALFPTELKSSVCYADGQLDVVEREIQPWSGWKNPSNCQRQ
ncbi:MAG: mannosylglycerate hydrolase, partial [Bacteroidetes bacterium]